jgi:hypothetical protein
MRATPALAGDHLAALAAAAVAQTQPAANPADITSMSQFRGMDDAQLGAYFAAGTAVMPSQEPPYNATGQPFYDFCVGRTYMNAFSPNSSIARSVWPTGLDNPFNNIYERIWWGKVFYNDGSNPNEVQAWNLMFSNKTVGFTALAYKNVTSPFGDGKPSVLMDFSKMEDRLVRPFVDEVRGRERGGGGSKQATPSIETMFHAPPFRSATSTTTSGWAVPTSTTSGRCSARRASSTGTSSTRRRSRPSTPRSPTCWPGRASARRGRTASPARTGFI